MLSKEEKERILKTIERDREFRYALMGLLGFKEILDRITKLEEGHLRLEERITRLEERQQRLEERIVKLEERFAKLEERFMKLEERVTRLEERVEQLSRAVVTIAHRFGALAEETFREAMSGILEKYFGVKASRWTYFDRDGLVYGSPSMVEVDLIIKDNVHILVEVKSRDDPGDVIELVKIGELYHKVTGVKPKLVIVAGFVRHKAKEIATKNNVEIYSYLEDKGENPLIL